MMRTVIILEWRTTWCNLIFTRWRSNYIVIQIHPITTKLFLGKILL